MITNTQVVPFNENIIEARLHRKVRISVADWAANSTCHGLPNISRSKNSFLKIIWTVCFITSTTYCSIQIIKSIQNYLEYPVTVDLRYIHESPTYFPAITFCNLNPFNLKRSQSFVDSVLNKYNLSVDKIGTANAIDHATLMLEKLRLEVKYKNLNSSELKRLGFTLDEMLISCSFNSNPCELNDFYWFYSYEHGSCYTFNQGFNDFNNKSSFKPIKSISESGISHGLQIEFYVGNVETLQFSYQTGMIMVIHNQSLLPDFESGYLLPPGFETNILIDRTFTYKLDYPFSTCIKDVHGKASLISDLYKSISNNVYVGEYNRKDCIGLCYQKTIETKCGCSAANVFAINLTLGICYTTSQLSCLDKERDIFYASQVYDNCINYCPDECDSIDYAGVSSSAIYPSAWYSSLLQKQANFKKYFDNGTTTAIIRESALKINVFYDDLVYMLSDETQAVKIENQLAEIGGQLGLFIGISFLSLIEIIEIIFEVISLVCYHYQTEKINKHMFSHKK